MYFLLLYDLVDDYVTRRAPFREAHLKLVRAACDRGEMPMAGSYGDPVEGALLLFHSADASAAERFAAADPYVANGLVTRWRVYPWHEVLTTG